MSEAQEREAFEAWRRRTTKMDPDGAVALRGFGEDSGYDNTYTRCMHMAWMARAALSAPAELRGVAEAIDEGGGFWRSCSGCHELNEGHATGPYSNVFRCNLGNGCSECGGIGAVWDDTDYDAMADFMAQSLAAPTAPTGAQAEPPITDKSHPSFIAGYDAGLHDRELEKLDAEQAAPKAEPPQEERGQGLTEGSDLSGWTVNGVRIVGRDGGTPQQAEQGRGNA